MALDRSLLTFTVATWVLCAAFAVHPLLVDRRDDQGDGRAKVILPKPAGQKVYRRRVFAYFAVGLLLSLVVIGLHRYQPSLYYEQAMGDLATALTHQPGQVQAYVHGNFLPVSIEILWLISLLSLACTLRLTPGRRLVVAGHAVLFFTTTVITQGLIVAVGSMIGAPVVLVLVIGTLVNVFIGVVVTLRVVMTTFMLPRRNAVPRLRQARPWDSVLTVAALLFAVSLILFLAVAVVDYAGGSRYTGRLALLFPSSIMSIVTGIGLAVVRPHARRRRRPAEPPPIDVITPAFNEEAGIHLTLESIERAAARYPGRVRAIVSNDGSTDRTRQIVFDVMSRFRHAEGICISHPNTGKAGALNRGLAQATADIVVRLDADCVLHPDALVYTAPCFDDPDVGIVGALMLPRPDNTGWFARMRAIECLFTFACSRMGQQMVDGVAVIPGTFTAFRRQPMVELGGYTEGMNGEDADQTCQFGRIGYRSIVDKRVICYEDVPVTLNELLEQRTRWYRAGVHVFARHNPVRNGLAGPRTWLYLWRRVLSWSMGPALLLTPGYLILLISLTDLNARFPVLFLLAIPLLADAALFVLVLFAGLRHRAMQFLPWFPTYIAFNAARRLAFLEAMMSMPTRPLWRPRSATAPVGAVDPQGAGPAPEGALASASMSVAPVAPVTGTHPYLRDDG